jgi:hypothetical protein
MITTSDNSILIFGGEDESGLESNKLYKLDYPTASWTRIFPSSTIEPPARHSLNAMYHQETDSLFIHGGMKGSFAFCDAWSFDFKTNEWSEINLDAKICRGRAAFASIENILYFHGGIDQTYNIGDSLYTININDGHVKEIEIHGDVKPSEQTYGSMLASEKTIYLYGGSVLANYYDTLYSFDTGLILSLITLVSQVWSIVEPRGISQEASSGGSMIEIDEARILLTGGVNSAGYLSRSVIYNHRDNTWVLDVS